MFVKAELWTVGKTRKGLAVLLRLPSLIRCIPIFLEDDEAHDLLVEMGTVKENPPNLQALVSMIIKESELKIQALEIRRVKRTMKYQSTLKFVQDKKQFSLEAKTTDALILSASNQVPIYVEDSIAEEDAIGMRSSEPEIPRSVKLVNLQNQLKKLVQEENYEHAALIRDEIQRIVEIMKSDTTQSPK